MNMDTDTRSITSRSRDRDTTTNIEKYSEINDRNNDKYRKRQSQINT